jgi:PAS domain S-box-containing protein
MTRGISMKNILAVDNDRFILDFVDQFLSERGYRVVTVDSGLSALDILNSYTPDAIFVDLIMPNIDGKDLCKIIRKNKRFSDTYLFIMSAISAEEEIDLEELGVNACIAKGPMDKFKEAILNMIERIDRPLPFASPDKVMGIENIFPRGITKELLDVKKHFGIILDKITEGILEVDREGRIVFANPKALEMIGRPLEAVLGANFVDFFSDVDRREIVEHWRELWHGHTLRESQIPLVLPPYSITIEIIPLDIQEEKCILILNDVTESLKNETALRESKDLYQGLFENSGAAIITFRDDMVITKCNDEFVKLSGYPKEEIEARMKCTDFIHQQDLKTIDAFQSKTFRNGKVKNVFEFKFNNRSGSVRHVLNRMVMISDTSESICCMIDITDRVEAQMERENLEAQLRQVHKMEAIGTLAGGIAHDFNNILAAIIGYTELVISEIPEKTKNFQNLQGALNASMRAKELVRQILAFSRQTEDERKPVQIAPVVKEALKLLRSSLPATIDIRQQISEDLDNALADSTQVHQIVMNLCTNAAHAMPNNEGTLEVSLIQIKLTSEDIPTYLALKPGDYLCLTVKDNGQGMTPDVMRFIFDPYYTKKEKGSGTGLGLSVVHGIVKRHKGEITAHSVPGKGSTFHVYLPVIQQKPLTHHHQNDVLQTGSERILFIDDEPALVDMGKQMLERLGYDVQSRSSSIEAFELFKTQVDRFDLAVIDMTMPHMTGLDLAIKFLAIRPEFPIILCTGYSELVNESKAKDFGIRQCLMKPVTIVDLAAAIRKVLDR